MATPLVLRKLQKTDEPALRQAIAEFKTTDPHFTFIFNFTETTPLTEYLDLLAAQERGERLNGFVPVTFMVATIGPKIIGRVSIRHQLNDFLLEQGGHIGYGVVPSERRKGYAKQILKLALAYIKTLGITRVLLTCDEDNLPSCRVIEANGGILENTVKTAENKPLTKRYWINQPASP